MKEDTTAEKDEALNEVRIKNTRFIRKFFISLGAVVIIGLVVRLTKSTILYYSQRPPKTCLVADKIPGYYSEEEVMTFITNGVSMKILVQKYGQPFYSHVSPEGFTRHIWVAPEAPHDRAYDFAFSGFTVKETNDVVFWKGAAHMSSY